MNCDQAFERLTDAQSADDAELAQHLRDCPRCRDMQQTLSPAMDWLRRSVDEKSTGRSHPWRDGRACLLTEESVAVAMKVAQRLPRVGHRSALHQALGIALVAMFGMMLGVFVISQRQDVPPKPTASATFPAAAAMCLWTHRENEPRTATATNVVDSCIACHVPAMMRN